MKQTYAVSHMQSVSSAYMRVVYLSSLSQAADGDASTDSHWRGAVDYENGEQTERDAQQPPWLLSSQSAVISLHVLRDKTASRTPYCLYTHASKHRTKGCSHPCLARAVTGQRLPGVHLPHPLHWNCRLHALVFSFKTAVAEVLDDESDCAVVNPRLGNKIE